MAAWLQISGEHCPLLLGDVFGPNIFPSSKSIPNLFLGGSK
jgi:hypothetical protein